MGGVKIEWKLSTRTCTNINSASVFPLLVYGVEVLLKISGLGPMAYFSSGWNLWVITWTLGGLIDMITESKSLGYAEHHSQHKTASIHRLCLSLYFLIQYSW